MTDSMSDSDAAESENEVNELLQKIDFGSSLRLAREKSGMSLTDVAENLLISVDIIKALENSQADVLPALAFTQGYIRSYARLLDVSAEEVINGYVKTVPDSKQVLTPNSVLPAQKCCNDKIVKLISVSFFVFAISVLVYWLLNTDFKIDKNVDNKIAEFESQSNKLNDLLNKDNADNILPAQQNSHSTLSLSDDVEPAEVVSGSGIDEVSQEQTLSHVADEVENTAAPIEDKLFLSALDDSWCEIQDSTGKRLYYQLLNTGEEIELTGVAPFIVFLGNAPKIRVEVNNKIVDFDELINKNSNIASLKISRNAAVVSLTNN